MIGWLDCTAGASGDMLLGALVAAGVPVESLQQVVDQVAPGQVRLRSEQVHRAGLAATRVHVETDAAVVERTWADVRALLTASELTDSVRTRAIAVFQRLAEAEAAVHGVDADSVHFHEVGALDAIADVVGVVAGFELLGLDSLAAGPVTLGSGTTRGAHGPLPVPAPAVLALLTGVPVQGGPAPYEMTTPTGAALLAGLVSSWGPLPQMSVENVGVGAGGRDPAEVANVLRLLIGEPAAQRPAALVLETNVDDLDPRLWPGVIESLLAAGASDAWLTPILMKKGRPAHTLSVLCPPDLADAVRQVVFTQTTTIGMREHSVAKHALDRSERTMEIGGQSVRVKVATFEGRVVNAMPEYDDVVAAAAALGRPVRQVLGDLLSNSLRDLSTGGTS